MDTYQVTLTGKTPLLMHCDNIDASEVVKVWQKDPSNKDMSVPGDDRSPPFVWIGYLYHDGKRVGVTSDAVMVALRDAGAKVSKSRGRGSLKSETQSGMQSLESQWDLLTHEGRAVLWSDIAPLMKEPDFAAHEARASELGFSLFKKRAKVGTNKHVRVRPRFEAGWTVSGHIAVIDPQITRDVLTTLFQFAGRFKGLGDWRPSSPKAPGPFGQFEAKVKKV